MSQVRVLLLLLAKLDDPLPATKVPSYSKPITSVLLRLQTKEQLSETRNLRRPASPDGCRLEIAGWSG